MLSYCECITNYTTIDLKLELECSKCSLTACNGSTSLPINTNDQFGVHNYSYIRIRMYPTTKWELHHHALQMEYLELF